MHQARLNTVDSGHYQTPKVEFLQKITISIKSFILVIWQGCEYASEITIPEDVPKIQPVFNKW